MITKVHFRDRRGNVLGYVDQSELTEFQRYRVLNGQHVLSMTFPANTAVKGFIQKYNRLMFFDTDLNRWFEFSVSSVTENFKDLQVMFESSFYSALRCFIPFVNITGNTVVNGMYKLFELAYPESEWTVGTSDISGSYYMQRTDSTLKDALMDWAEKCGGEIDAEVSIGVDGSVTRQVSIYSRMGQDRGLVLYDDREITDITRKVPQGDIYTAAFGYGNYLDTTNADGQVDRVTFEGIEWSVANGDPVDKPLGQKYVSLGQEALESLGQFVGGEFSDSCTCFDFDTEDPAVVLQRTYDSLIAQIADPAAYTIKAADFASLGIETDDIGFGDSVGVVAKVMGLKFKTRCIAKRTDYLNPASTTFEFNTRPAQVVSAISSIGATAQAAERIASESYYGGVLTRWNNEINADQAWVYADPVNGFNTYNTQQPETASKVTSIKGGSIRIANSKTAGQWNWSTVLTGDGLVINQLTSNIIEGENFELDMRTGILSFGERDADGNISPVMQLQSSGFTLLGNEINGEFTPESIAFLNNVSGDVIAKFTAEGAEMPTAIINKELRIGTARWIPYPEQNRVVLVINDYEG